MPVTFKQFLTSGGGLTHRPLGAADAAFYIRNGVELQFAIGPDVASAYKNVRPKQWAGPDVIFKKAGAPLTAPWVKVSQSQGGQPDDPEPENVFTRTNIIAFHDAPGPNMSKYLKERPSRIYTVQLFTAWIEGTPLRGGSPQRLCDVVAWHSVTNLADSQYGESDSTPRWARLFGTRAALGWMDTNRTPPA